MDIHCNALKIMSNPKTSHDLYIECKLALSVFLNKTYSPDTVNMAGCLLSDIITENCHLIKQY